ncbi:MAG: hypothetical protein HQ581_01970 [Planctomycetes bacterium]|nr:hypothetical protein [Planctomycetota bacterium]
MRRLWRCGKISALAISVLCFSGPVAGAPDHENPDAPLAVRPEEPNLTLSANATQLWKDAWVEVGEYAKKAQAGNVAQLDMAAIGRTYVKLRQLDRLARQLLARGESAGVDFQFRTAELDEQLQSIMKAYRQLPDFEQRSERGFQFLLRDATKNKGNLRQCRGMMDQGQWEQAETAFYQMFDSLEAVATWFSARQRKEAIEPFLQAQAELDKALGTARKERGAADLAAARKSLTPDFEAIVAPLRQASAAVGRQGTAVMAGQTLTGPALIERFGELWQQVHHATLRCRGIDWARELEPDDEQSIALAAGYTEFCGQMALALAELIDADAARVSAAEVRPLYTAYLQRLAPLVSLAPDDSLRRAVTPALERLAAKSPPLAGEVAAYRNATSDLLRWRQRIAASQASQWRKGYLPLAEQFVKASRKIGTTQGLVSSPQLTNVCAEFTVPVPAVMQPAVAGLMGQPVTLDGLVGFRPDAQMATTRYQARTCAMISLPGDVIATQVRQLEADLMVGPNAPPLTLEAAEALATAARGDLTAAGGTIVGTYLEAISTRFATLGSGGRLLVPLGSLPRELNREPLQQVLMRFTVKPAWISHRYFFVKLP